jgi:ATP-binding cassette, subfamily C, bacterial LapB
MAAADYSAAAQSLRAPPAPQAARAAAANPAAAGTAGAAAQRAGSVNAPHLNSSPNTGPATGPNTSRSPDPGATRLREDLISFDPLLDCLVEVCRLHGVAASRSTLTATLPLNGERLSLELAERAAARVGMATKVQRLGLEALDPATLPVVLILKGNRACVLTACSQRRGEARLLLPETGQGAVTVRLADLAARYSGVALFVRPHFRFDTRSSHTSNADAAVVEKGQDPHLSAGHPLSRHWFWGVVLEQRGVYRDVLLAALLINLFAVAFPMFSMNVYDRVVPNHAVETLWALAVGVLLILAADLGMRLLRSRFVDEASARIDVQLSAQLMERVLGMRLENRPASVGSFAQNLRGFEQVRDFIASSTVTTLIDLPFALLFLAVMVWISPWLALPVIVAGATILALGWALQKRLQELAETTHRASATRSATLIESLHGIETIKSQGAESSVQAKWERTNAFLSTTNIRMRSLSCVATSSTAVITQCVTVAIIVIGVYLINERLLTMGALIACSTLSGRALAPAGQVVGLLMQYQGVRTSLAGLNQLMAQPQERPPGRNFLQRPQMSGDIELRGVSFRYPGREDKVLDNLNIKIKAGERVALIGRVGSGKSTIQRLMMGLYQPTDGAVLMDGTDLRQLDPADVRRNQAYVSQDVMLFFGTLRDNIAFGLPFADDSAVRDAAEVACMNEFVSRHPRGFDMPVGERGESLSGGQRQCVGLARAVLHNAPILLLDEPTSAMDFSTEAQITQRIGAYAANKTVVLVTHRTSMLAMVNRVIVIDGGKVVADGPRDRIMEALAHGRIARAA